jgi:hypothetical protein
LVNVDHDSVFVVPTKPSFAPLFGTLAFITLVRLIALYFSKVDLFYDKSPYWAWSRELAFGYATKPPLLAWLFSRPATFAVTVKPSFASLAHGRDERREQNGQQQE